ncbi:putative cytokinesis regulator (Byr4) [Penicillium brasilianum]|uniref:Putative cytokinesis regulator (Byr4) n=1 Tax=Penicillium brasilianum TaxID=104259 RepID=A0A1S9S040_PENBI|nr:putative cytokinesis regulator (Byr4) [Penicillium brasilianum]
MEFPTTQERPHGTDEVIECWDDDDDLQFNDGIQFRATSSTGSLTNSSFRPSGHRDSISSRLSARSDLDSNAGDEDWQVLLHDNDEFSKEEALASAKHAGIPIPADIPSSALIGGAIKRLSARKSKRTFVDDWSDDVELPGPGAVLELKTPRDNAFPDSLRQISSAATSPVKSTSPPFWNDDISTRLQAAFSPLERFQDENNHPMNFEVPTINAPTPRSPKKSPVDLAGFNHADNREMDDFDEDLELPPDHQPLQLSHRKDRAEVSSPIMDDFDLEWSEGSIGVRVGGTARDGRSIPSSSISIASPSVSSCLTAESEEDGLDGVLFPEGPLDFTASLKRRQEAQAIDSPIKNEGIQKAPASPDADDFFSGLEVDHGRAFVSGKMALNPNVKCKTEWPSSPTRRPATTLTFTNATGGSPRTRIPRLSGHERTHSTHLETVSESGAPLSKFRRSQSRLGHSSQSSVSSLPATSAKSPSPTPSTSSRRLLGSRAIKESPNIAESKGPSRQLRTKRSLPSIRGITSATSTLASQRTPTHADGSIRGSLNRPKTPVERTAALDGRGSVRRVQAPFLSAASERKPQNAGVKNYRSSRRTNSDSSGDLLSPQGTFSRLSRPSRPESLRLSFGDSGAETTGSTTKRTLTKPTKRRNFGDGTELESFDDLPTSASTESKFTKNPTGRGAPRSVRSRLSQSRITPPINSPTQSTPPSVSKPLNPTPRFARDTNASRNAREQRIASMNSRTRDTTPLSSVNANWKPHPVVSRISPSAAPVRSRKTKPVTKSSSKPHLIKPLGSGVHDAKSVRGMRYNPSTFRWEGNENLVQDFDVATAPKSPKPAPALITNVGPLHNVQSVGGMVFDPQRMCWLKASALESAVHGGAVPEDEDDVFAGLDDLDDDKTAGPTRRNSGAVDDLSSHTPGGEDASAGESSDDCLITEEFDVGPEFIRRQRAEEEKWRRKVAKWIGPARGDREHHWRWAIRDLVAEDTGHLIG